MKDQEILESEIHRDPRDEFPNQPISEFLLHVLEEQLNQYGDLQLFTDWNSKDSLSSSQLLEECQRVAVGLQQRGVRRGDFVACLIYSNVHYYSFLIGSWMCGCILTSLQQHFTQEMMADILNESKARLLICDQESVERCLAVRKSCSHLEEIFVLGHFEGCTSFESLIQSNEVPIKMIEPYDPNEAVSMVFSSGTTGFPKGILLTHTNIYSYLLSARPHPALGMKILFVPRLCNIFGIYFGLRGLLIHSHTFLISSYDDDALFDAIDQIQPERLLIFLPHILTLINHPRSDYCENSSVRAIFTAGMPIGTQLKEKLFQKIPSIQLFCNFYGMTEFAVGTIQSFRQFETNTYSDESMRQIRSKPNSVGRLYPMNQLKIVDQTSGRILGPNYPGEICLKGPSAFKCYWNNPKATEDIKRDGWIHTGDIGFYDKDGDVFYVQRSKELIKFLGHHVVPAILESILRSHEAVEDAAVVGVIDEYYGELPRAYVVKKSEFQHVKSEDLIDYVNDRVEDKAQLRGGLAFVEMIPRNNMGKILRNLLRERAKLESNCSQFSLF